MRSTIAHILIASVLCFGQSMFLLPSEPGSPLEGNFSYHLSRKDSLVKVKIALQLSNNALQFIRKDGAFMARYRIDAAIYEDGELLVNKSYKDSVSVATFSATNLAEPWYAGSLSFVLPKGKYELFILLNDLNAKTDAQAIVKLKIPDAKYFRLSTPWFFVSGSDSVVISSHIPVLWDSLGVAAIAYDIPESARCELVISGVRHRAKTYKGKFIPREEDTIIAGFFPISKMPGGEYDAQLRMRNMHGKKIASTKTQFTLIQTPMSMYRFHFDELLNQLEIIANPSEISALEEADSTARDSLWSEFWQKRDPTPTTELNEVKEEFFRRVQYSNENFGTPSRPGWKSDRGRVYITYGQPDEIERHPFELNSKPYEVWYYYSLGLTFVFVDTYGDGDYRLRETR